MSTAFMWTWNMCCIPFLMLSLIHIYWQEGMEPYYPINDERNQSLYQKYKKLADKEDKVLFGGRLAEYKYYDMDKVIESAFQLVEKEL